MHDFNFLISRVLRLQISRILASLERLERGVSIGDVRLFTNAAIKRESMISFISSRDHNCTLDHILDKEVHSSFKKTRVFKDTSYV